MIDFPASPTDGQIFSPPNGVIYRYSTTHSSWLVQTAPPVLGGTGEVTAVSTVLQTLTAGGGAVLVPFATVVSGNAGLWWNTATNRYIPPAGKYFLTTTLGLSAGGSGNASVQVSFRKNGVALTPSGVTSMSPGFNGSVSMSEYVDANGSDFFDVVVAALAGASTGTQQNNGIFSAFPLTGIQGPTGASPGSGVGDFFAQNAAQLNGIPAALTLLSGNSNLTVLTGNSGAYFNSTTGRFIPPAGRYCIFTSMTVANSASATLLTVQLRKNGAVYSTAGSTPAAAGWTGPGPITVTADANGSDYFEVWASANNGANIVQQSFFFGAFPTQGLVGPVGPTGPANPTNVLRNFFSGFVPSAPGSQSMTWGAGQAADSLNATWISLPSPITKSIATSWVVGTGNGGRGTGVTLTANTWYFPFAIINGASVDVYFDTSVTGANAPAGTTAKRRLRAIKTDGSSNIIAHTGKGDLVQWTTCLVDLNGNDVAGLSQLVWPVSVPPGLAVEWQGRVTATNNGTGQVFQVYLNTPGQGLSGGPITRGGTTGTGSATGAAASWARILTNTSQQLALSATTGAGNVFMWLYAEGFVDTCGRYD
jgi:hypothetical protein